jgi:hypothetical protein
MHRLVALIFLAAIAGARADDAPPILSNGDFSDGLNHWYGDIHAPPDNDDGTPGTGATIKLQRETWSIATHEFDLPPGTYKLHVTFELEPLTKFSTELTDYMHIAAKANFTVKNSDPDAQPGQWLAIVNDPAAGTALYWEVDPTQPTGKQSYTFTLRDINPQNRQTLMLAFPPGKGEVHLVSASIVPETAPAPPTTPFDSTH